MSVIGRSEFSERGAVDGSAGGMERWIGVGAARLPYVCNILHFKRLERPPSSPIHPTAPGCVATSLPGSQSLTVRSTGAIQSAKPTLHL